MMCAMMLQVNSNEEEVNTLALKAAESVKEQRHSRDLELQRRLNAKNASAPNADAISITSTQSLPVSSAQNGFVANTGSYISSKNAANTSPYGSHSHHPHFSNHIGASPGATGPGIGTPPVMHQSASSNSLQTPHTPSPMSTGSSSSSSASGGGVGGGSGSGPPTPGSLSTPSPRGAATTPGSASGLTDPFKQVSCAAPSTGRILCGQTSRNSSKPTATHLRPRKDFRLIGLAVC